jgi:hypothetical protein
MGGFSAIGAGNGWTISALGISVVFFGLASLAFIISYFPRAISWWNDHAQTPNYLFPLLKSLFKKPRRKMESLLDVRGIQEPGKLPRLIEMAEQRGLARVYSTINRLLVRGTIVGGADGLFHWAKGREKERQVKNKLPEPE